MKTFTPQEVFALLDRTPYTLGEVVKMLPPGKDRRQQAESLLLTKNVDLQQQCDRNQALMQGWLDRGDGIAVYENQAFDSSGFGHKKFVSFGSPAAQLPGDTPPDRLPNIGHSINWAYALLGVCRGR